MGFCTRCLTSYGECLTAESICIRCAEKDLKNLRAEVGRLSSKLGEAIQMLMFVRAHWPAPQVREFLDKFAAQPEEKPAIPPRVEIQTGPKDTPKVIAPVPSSELRLTPHGRIIHEKNTIDVSGFPFPPETLDNEPAAPTAGGGE